jgi:signal transduction histidine kinase
VVGRVSGGAVRAVADRLRAAIAPVTVRDRLVAIAVWPLLGVLLVLAALLAAWSSALFDRMLIVKVRSDLAVAHQYFERTVAGVGANVGNAAASARMQEAIRTDDGVGLRTLLERLKRDGGLDFLAVHDARDRLLMADDGRGQVRLGGTAEATDPARALGAPIETVRDRRVAGHARLAVIDRDALRAMAPALLDRVGLALVPTPNAAPTDREREDRALVVLASEPIEDADGRLLGWVHGGTLLNVNLDFIDRINAIVYPEGSLPFGSRGTATLFLDDVRITTNVKLFGDRRAIGTRVSQSVRDAVLGRGETWLDRAFVVDDWFVSGYEPLEDAGGRRVGMLYVGYAEGPFRWIKRTAVITVFAVVLLAMFAALRVSLRWSGAIFTPVERMTDTMRRVEAGDADARVGPLPNRDELGRLAEGLDHLLDTVDEKTRALRALADSLDRQVAERSAALEQVQQQVLRNEKLATVGQLTAGVAHEINNPMAVIQANLDFARELLGPAAEPVREELGRIDAQVERVRRIVAGLLQYAKPAEFVGYVHPVDVGAVLDECLVLAGTRIASGRVAIRRESLATRPASINPSELQQVLVNLLLNALQAMPDGGELSVATRDGDAGTVEIEVADRGPGLSEAALASLFKPFNTTKQEGTGLGLWVSSSLVERYGGRIVAANREDGQGARFVVVLPAAARV